MTTRGGSSEPEIGGVVGDAFTLTTTTPGLTIAKNRPEKAIAVGLMSVFATTVATPTWNLTPRLKRAYWFDDSAQRYTDITNALRDRVTADATLTAFEGAADPFKDFIYLCCNVPFRGVYLDIGTVNAIASILGPSVPTAQGTWVNLVFTDGSAAAGATFAQDAPITWTVPATWVPTTEGPAIGGAGDAPLTRGYWMRMGATVTLSATVTIANMVPLPIQTASAIMLGAITSDAQRQLAPPRFFFFNPDEIGGIMATGATAEVVRATWLCRQDRGGLVAE